MRANADPEMRCKPHRYHMPGLSAFPLIVGLSDAIVSTLQIRSPLTPGPSDMTLGSC